eukprot:Blabericola_migrator_1__1848@NODE_1500_length_4404_cov_54_217662_g599_i2_p5_GENE_NODE_1500_length_4404_cov_54_217662_g599_i2NODE_1500_length_4404_cov_54_217662_g599_i2_p5_ORF_typecomplete_len115_score11_77_NODE_1500_length_4404_cov_54_217662_g599_i212741618
MPSHALTMLTQSAEWVKTWSSKACKANECFQWKALERLYGPGFNGDSAHWAAVPDQVTKETLQVWVNDPMTWFIQGIHEDSQQGQAVQSLAPRSCVWFNTQVTVALRISQQENL